MIVTASRIKSFEEKFVRGGSGDCWEWRGAVFSGPKYGQLSFGGYAHRFAWLVYRGSIPEGLHVLHSCDNRLCVNPAHLFLGTNQDNIDDKVAKNRQKPGGFGERSNLAKLTEDQARSVLKRYRRTGHNKSNCGELAQEFGVTKTCIQHILQGRNWKHLTEG